MKWKSLRSRLRQPQRRPISQRRRLTVESLEARCLPTSILTYHVDNFNSGVNPNETVLTPANVNANSFGKLFSVGVDGQVYAEPLVMTGINIPGQGTHDVVFVATQHDSVFAIDANNGAVLWQRSLLMGLHGGTVTTVPNGEVSHFPDIHPEIGITSTPVIDPATNTIYVEAKTKEAAGDGNHYIHQLHALDVGSGAEKFGGPAVIADTMSDLNTYTYVSGPFVNGSGAGQVDNVTTFDGGNPAVDGTVIFNALRQMNRCGLTLANGNVYLGFGSHGDEQPYHGWLLSFNAANLQLNGVFNSTPNGNAGGIWMSSGKLPVAPGGFLMFNNGHGTFDFNLDANGFPSNGDFGLSYVKIGIDNTTSPTNQGINGWGLKAVDYFTPFNQQALSNADLDLSGGITLLPRSAASAAHTRLMVGGGKEGRLYLIDRANMGHFNPNFDNVVGRTGPQAVSGVFDTPAFFNGQLYVVGGSNVGNPPDVGKTFGISNAQLSGPLTQGGFHWGFPGANPFISANGTLNGVVWVMDRGIGPTTQDPGLGQMRAYDARGFNRIIYSTTFAPNNRDDLGEVMKFSTPTVANGKVYAGTASALVVYGILPGHAPVGKSAVAETTLSDTGGTGDDELAESNNASAVVTGLAALIELPASGSGDASTGLTMPKTIEKTQDQLTPSPTAPDQALLATAQTDSQARDLVFSKQDWEHGDTELAIDLFTLV